MAAAAAAQQADTTDTIIHCIKHPNPDHHTGICSSCLKEKLANLTPPGTINPDFTSIVFHSSSISSSPGFSSSSTPNKANADAAAAAVVGFVVHMGNGGGGVLRKSRSVTCEAGLAVGEGKTRGKSGGGFWKRLIRTTSKKTKGVLMMSSKRIE